MIRLLVLPNDIAGIAENLRWIRDELGPKTAISLMAQYYATNKAATDERYILLSRRISEGEWFEAVSLLRRSRHGRGLYAGIRIGVALLSAGFCGRGKTVQGH